MVLSGAISAGGSYLSQSSADLYFAIPENSEAQTIKISWPDGSESSENADGMSGLVELRHASAK